MITCRPKERDCYYWSRYRNYPVEYTPELISRVKELAKEGKSILDIADEIQWPVYKSLRQIRLWVME